ncbi:MAG: NIPSNAP family protein [Verrucomicrobiota bacterium]
MKKCICFLLVLPFWVFAESPKVRPAPGFFELRTYHTHPGKLDALHARFSEHTIPLFRKYGMTNIAYWTPKDQPDTLIYLMGYPSREAREGAWKGFLNDPDWKAAYKASTAGGKLVARLESLYLEPTDYTPALKIDTQEPTRLFELRIYTTNEGKLDGLNARFRDHTVALFGKHGITNIAYFTPAKESDGARNKLVYIVSHKDEATRKAAFGAFGRDPAWQSARKNSEVNGKLLVKKGVNSTFLVPTVYSPMK